MNAALKAVAPSEPPAIDIGWLAETIRRNRFMPTPSYDQVFVGDGDFRGVGAEFLRHCVELGGLAPDARVLDLGCGIGRLAVPLTQYLDPDHGTYDGIDPVLAGIEWCRRFIAPAYPRFRFHHLDVKHPIYHPEGGIAGTEVTLPFEAGTIDFTAMISLVTHLSAAEVRHYAGEAARVLAPGGVVFLTAFIIDKVARTDTADKRLAFSRAGGGPEWHADPEHPMSAVAFDEGFIESVAAANGLSVRRKLVGHWSGRPADHFQDIFVIEKRKANR